MPCVGDTKKVRVTITGPEFEPTADDVAWKAATPGEKDRYWRHVGVLAYKRKLLELHKAIGTDGAKLKPRKWPRADGADGPVLVPHYNDSRFQTQLRWDGTWDSAKGHGIARLWWTPKWSKVVGYHARGEVKGAPVRNQVGLTREGQAWVAGAARKWWKGQVAAKQAAVVTKGGRAVDLSGYTLMDGDRDLIESSLSFSGFRKAPRTTAGGMKALLAKALRGLPPMPPPPAPAPPPPPPPPKLPPSVGLARARAHDAHADGPWGPRPAVGPVSYGGVVVDERGRILLREPAGHFDGYRWTFPKGKPDPGDHPAETALREVLEETGHRGAFLGYLPGGYRSGSSTTYFYMMRSKGHDPSKMDRETSAVRWVTPEEARALISTTTNARGRERDLAILAEVERQLGIVAAGGKLPAIPRPRKPRAAPAPKPAAPPPPDDFPDLAELRVIRRLGGSTGAELVEDSRGRRYVRKRGNSAEHVREEALADSAYRALGARVPAFKLFETAAGPVKLAEFVEGRTLADVKKADPKLYARAVEDLRRHFAADALLGNWDVVGMGMDNVLVDARGQAWRIDNGGSLRFRAQGTRKAADQWDAYPTELWTLRDASTNRQTAETFGALEASAIARQVRELEGRAKALDAVLPKEVLATVQARLRQLRDVATTTETFVGDRWREGYADEIGRHQVGLRKAGIVDKMATRFTPAGSRGVRVVDQDGKDWDRLRGKDSLVKELSDYIKKQGGDYRAISTWMASQGGDSWSDAPSAFKAFLHSQRDQPEAKYFWKHGLRTAQGHLKTYAAQAGGLDAYATSVAAQHAFTRELLMRAEFPKKGADGTVELMRTENLSVMRAHNLKRGAKGATMPRGFAESTSIYRRVTVHGTEMTTQKVPLHRVFGTYWQERSPGSGRCAFLGDGENEFVCLLDDLPFDYQ